MNEQLKVRREQLREIQSKKNDAEMDITAYTQQVLEKLSEETGLRVTGCSFSILDVYEIGGEQKSAVLGECEIDLQFI